MLCMMALLFTACSREKESAEKEFAYVAEYRPLELSFDYLSEVAADGDMLYFLGAGWDEETQRHAVYLYVYDLDNGTGKAINPDPDQEEDFYRMGIDQEGNLLVIANGYEYITDDAGEITDVNLSFTLKKLSKEDGSVLESRDISKLMGEEEDSYIQYFCVDGQGNLYFANSDGKICVTDRELNKLFELQENEWIEDMTVSGEGTVYVASYGDTGLEMRPIDLKTKDLGEALPEISGYGNLKMVSGTTGSFLASETNAVSVYDTSAGTKEALFEWLDVDVNSNNIRYIGEMTDGRIWAVSEDYSQSESHPELIVIKKVAASEVTPKEELTYGTLYLDYDVREEIIRFNKHNETYRIKVKEYVQDDYDAGIIQFSADLTSTDCPDIIDLSSIDYEMYAEKGVLEDLYPYMEKSKMNPNDYLENVLKAYERDGKLYGVMSQFYVITTLAKASKVGDISGWTLSEMLDFAEKENAENVLPYATRDSIFYYCIYNNINEFIDWETGECAFDGEDFIRTLEFAAQFPEEYDYNADEEGTYAKLQNDRILLLQNSIGSVQEFQMLQGMFGEKVAYVGYPDSERKGNLIQPAGGSMGMSAKSAHKDGAWEFIQYLLTEEYQDALISEHGNAWGFPVKKSALEKQLKQDMTPEYYTDENGDQVEQMKTSWGYDDFNIDIYAAAEEEIAQVRALLESAKHLSGSVNDQLINIVTEESGAFFRGQKSAADTAGVIQNRIQIYVNENR